ncbi:MAG TPA: TIGR03086 family metal-binding protein [Nocardioides sp.]
MSENSTPVATSAPTSATALREDYVARAERFARVLDGADGRWDSPSPCVGWDARAVVRHVVDTERELLERHGLAVPPAPELGTGPTGPVAEAWRAHVAATAAVLTDEVLDRTYDGFFGPTTIGATLRDFYTWDLLVHGWDVARATGQPYVIDEADAAAHDAAADGWGDALYADGICAAAVPVAPDASAGDRLLGRLGRDPHWVAA